MAWQILHKPSYDTNFIDLDKALQRATINAIHDLSDDPITPKGNTIKALKGYKNVWRYRLGDFRLIYAVKPEAKLVQLLAVGPRSKIYRGFNYPGWDAPDSAAEFGPELIDQPEWTSHPEWFQAPAPEKNRLDRKLTPSLLKRWRIDPQYHPYLMRCLYEDDLLGISPEQVPPEVLGIVVDALFPPQVDQLASQPDQVLFDPEDLARYADGDLAGFLLHLDEQQEPLTSWALAGPTLVKGGPGSGKSTVALYRLQTLVSEHQRRFGSLPQIMFTTYTNSLISSSESLIKQLLQQSLRIKPGDRLPKQIRVTTLHKTAIWIAYQSGEKFTIAEDRQRREALHAARAALKPRALGDTQKAEAAHILSNLRDDYLLEEFDWVIAGQDCRTLTDYLGAMRAGRGTAFPEAVRKAVWQLYEAYQEYLLGQGLYTWGNLVQFALDCVRSGKFARRWDYVLVDEAQDLPPAALALCMELCRDPNGVFLTADANQSIYNRGFRWAHVHDQLKVVGRSRILRRNYRSTRQIAIAARQIMSDVPETDKDVVTQEYVHSGSQPMIYAADGGRDQANWIVGRITEAVRKLRLPARAAVVLVSSSVVGEPLARQLSDLGLEAKFMSSSDFKFNEPAVKVTTLHAAKGLEFPVVVIAHVEAGRLPMETQVTEQDELEAFMRAQRRLFYVGCTRAMRNLFITYDRQLPSPFLTDLTDDYWARV